MGAWGENLVVSKQVSGLTVAKKAFLFLCDRYYTLLILKQNTIY